MIFVHAPALTSIAEINRMSDSKATSDGSFIGSIDQGTTSTRFLIFNKDGEPIASHQVEFQQYYPQSGYVCSPNRRDIVEL